jgi:radical SAM-linked protein
LKRSLVKYSKEGEISFLSHRETMRCLERALRRAEFPMAYTSGYNPRPRISYSPALPLGVAAAAEYLEVVMGEETVEFEDVERINRALPVGLRVIEVQALASNMPRLSRWARYGLYRVSSSGNHTYLLLSLGGGKQGRLKDALQKMPSDGGPEWKRKVTWLGLYASRDEVQEDVEGTVFYFDGETGELKEMKND